MLSVKVYRKDRIPQKALSDYTALMVILPTILSDEISCNDETWKITREDIILEEVSKATIFGNYDFIFWVDASANSDRIKNAKERALKIRNRIKEYLPKNTSFNVHLQFSRSVSVNQDTHA